MTSLALSQIFATEIVDNCVEKLPEEACGLIAGDAAVAKQIIPIDNISATPEIRYQMHPEQLLKALKQIDKDHWSLLAIYHSHPRHEPIPSRGDMLEAHYPDVTHLIVGFKNNEARMKAWKLFPERTEPVELIVGNQSLNTVPSTEISQTQRFVLLLGAFVVFTLLITIAILLLPAAPDLPLTTP